MQRYPGMRHLHSRRDQARGRITRETCPSWVTQKFQVFLRLNFLLPPHTVTEMVKQGKEPTDTDTRKSSTLSPDLLLPPIAALLPRCTQTNHHKSLISPQLKTMSNICSLFAWEAVCRVREKGGLEAKPSRRRSSWPFLGRRPALPTSHPTRLQLNFLRVK